MAGPALKPPIEPLSQRTWQAIETRVFERLDQSAPPVASSSGRPTLAMGLAGLALAASVFALLQTSGGGQRASQGEPARVVAPAPAAAPAAVPAEPAAPAESPHIVTTTAPTEARLGDSSLRIAPQSALRIQGSDADGWRVLLEQGELSCEVAARAGRPPFVVSAGDVEVRVLGTRFSVIRRASGTRVRVENGHVQVEHAGKSSSIGPGESWPSTRPGHRDRTAARADLDPQRQFERAAQLESSNPTQALAIYRRISQAKGPWAANALYARARLLLDRGRQADARALLTRYAEKYPQGANAADARRLLESLPAPARAPQR